MVYGTKTCKHGDTTNGNGGKLSCIPKKILRKPIGFSIQTYGVDDAPGDPTNLGSRRGTWVKLEGKRNRNNHDNSHHHLSTKNK